MKQEELTPEELRKMTIRDTVPYKAAKAEPALFAYRLAKLEGLEFEQVYEMVKSYIEEMEH